MAYKGLVFAAAVVLAAFPATAANAGPAPNGLALQPNDASIVRIDYYYPGYDYDYEYREVRMRAGALPMRRT